MNNDTINNKFLYYKTKAAFDADIEAERISPNSIVFIEEVNYIYTHGHFYDCTTHTGIAQTTLSPRITLLENELAQYINGGATVSLKATPTSIFSNADNNGTNVTLRATASKDASVTITKGGNTIHTAAST